MAGGTVRLKGGDIHDQLVTNMHQLAQRAGASYTTIHKYLNRPDEMQRFEAEILYSLLIDGLGMSVEQAERTPLGDIFEFVTYHVNGVAE